MTMVMPLTKE